jgi:hypothetical protein
MIDETDACFIALGGQAAHPRRGWRIAANIAKLPGLLRHG